MRISVFAAVGSLAALSSGAAAADGGRFPSPNRVLFSPSDPNLVVARATYGILPSHDNGSSWSYLCDDALGLPATSVDDPEIALTAGNALIAGLPAPLQGLDVSPDVGCSWSCVGGPLANQTIADNVVRPDKPHVVLAVTSTYAASDAAVAFYNSQVFQSTDDGAHWTALGNPIDPSLLVRTIDVSRADASGNFSIYLSGTRGYGSGRTASLLVSTDEGRTWTEHLLQVFDPATEDSVYLGGVDPTDPKRVYLRSSAAFSGGRSRLFMTTDGGGSFTTPMTFQIPEQQAIDTVTGEALAFALSPDGSKVYVGTKGDGLFVASRAEGVFRKTSPIAVWCLATRKQELWVCSVEASTYAIGTPFVIGVTTDDGAHFTSKLPTIATLCGPLSCATGTRTSLGCNATVSGGQCQSSFDRFCQLYDVNNTCGACGSDAGLATDAAGGPSDASRVRTPSSTSSCGCALVSSDGTGALAAASAVAALALGRRRKHR